MLGRVDPGTDARSERPISSAKVHCLFTLCTLIRQVFVTFSCENKCVQMTEPWWLDTVVWYGARG